MTSSHYIESERKEYALYTLSSRAIPHAADGLKNASRRVLWIARDGKIRKTAALAGETMKIHPHGEATSAVESITGPYINNIPLFTGSGAFGTLLNPRGMAAPRYTSVSISQFTKDVLFKDIEIIPKQENYDGTLEEPAHFLPLIPVALLNPQEGIAVGFASNILPHSLESIIKGQIQHLTGKKIKPAYPAFIPTDNYCEEFSTDAKGNTRWIFRGAIEKLSAVNVKITNLPYGIAHGKFIDKLNVLEENGTIQEYEDNSKDVYNITVRFKKGQLRGMDEDEILKLLNLINTSSENMNVIDFDGERVWSTDFVELIQKFSDWRLEWYVKRYERLADILSIDIQRYKDILRAINKNIGSVAKKVKSRSELKEYLDTIGIVHVDYIADLAVYRFTEEEKKKVQEKLDEAEAIMKEYKSLLKSEPKRRIIYIDELKEVLKEYNKGSYNATT